MECNRHSGGQQGDTVKRTGQLKRAKGSFPYGGNGLESSLKSQAKRRMSPARSHNIFDYQKILAAVKELEESFADRIRKALEEKDKELKELEKILKQFLDGWDLIQVRRGGGKGSGFWKVEEKCLNIHQTKRRPEYREFLEQIKEQCQAILEVLK